MSLFPRDADRPDRGPSPRPVPKTGGSQGFKAFACPWDDSDSDEFCGDGTIEIAAPIEIAPVQKSGPASRRRLRPSSRCTTPPRSATPPPRSNVSCESIEVPPTLSRRSCISSDASSCAVVEEPRTEAPARASYLIRRNEAIRQKEGEGRLDIPAAAWNAPSAASSAAADRAVASHKNSPIGSGGFSPLPRTENSPLTANADGDPPEARGSYSTRRRTAPRPKSNPAVPGRNLSRQAVTPPRPRTPTRQQTKEDLVEAPMRARAATLGSVRPRATRQAPAAPRRATHEPATDHQRKPRAHSQPVAASSQSTAHELLPFFLASCPDRNLKEGIALMKKYGGFYAAGDKDDIFNKDVLTNPDADPTKAECWRVGWKGKVEMCYCMLHQLNPDAEKIVAIAIAGGPACDWERGEIRNKFCKVHLAMQLKVIGDMEDLEAWLIRLFAWARVGFHLLFLIMQHIHVKLRFVR